jgi:hypothetical protein
MGNMMQENIERMRYGKIGAEDEKYGRNTKSTKHWNDKILEWWDRGKEK